MSLGRSTRSSSFAPYSATSWASTRALGYGDCTRPSCPAIRPRTWIPSSPRTEDYRDARHLPRDLRYQELDDFRCDRIILVEDWQRADFELASSQAGDGDAAVGFGQYLHRGG